MSVQRLVAILIIFLIAAPIVERSALAADADAAHFITEFGNEMLKVVETQQSPKALEQSMRPIVLDAFDAPRIARFALGRYWSGLSEDERGQFTQAFEDYVVHVYAGRFSGYHGERFSVTGARPQGTSAALVTSEITQPEGGSPIKLIWQLDRVGERFKIVDVNVEGISQALTYRDEFTSIIRRDGGHVANLIAELREKAKT